MLRLLKIRVVGLAILLSLLLNLSFSILSNSFSGSAKDGNTTGLSGPIVSLSQSTEVLVFAAVKRITNYQGLKLFKQKFHRVVIFRSALLAGGFRALPTRAIFKINHSLKLEGG